MLTLVLALTLALTLALALLAAPAVGQEAAAPPDAGGDADTGAGTGADADADTDAGQAPLSRVDVVPEVEDAPIAGRIDAILEATGWYDGPSVSVEDGVVFLDGTTETEDHRDWARALALRTDGVVAVVNRIAVKPDLSWSMAPALREIRRIADRGIAALPLILLALLILPLAWIAAVGTARLIRWLLPGRVQGPFLRDVIARAVAIPVFLAGPYIVLQVAGLTQLALSLVGGAGVIGIVIGFAFRDIAENFLASLLLSIRKPFEHGDLIVVAGQRGFVQSMNTRSTVLVSEDGNHIQIPNATVFKNIIENMTAAPTQRGNLSIGIGYDASIAEAQELILGVLGRHAAVAGTPEPMALVDSLGASTVNMKGYYWFDGRAYSPLKLRSMLLRQVKTALAESGVSMPDEAREVIFPEGVPIVSRGAEEAGGTGPGTGPGTSSETGPATGSQTGPQTGPQTGSQTGPGAPPRRLAARAPGADEITAAETDLSNERRTLDAQMATPVENAGTDLLRS